MWWWLLLIPVYILGWWMGETRAYRNYMRDLRKLRADAQRLQDERDKFFAETMTRLDEIEHGQRQERQDLATRQRAAAPKKS